MKKTHATPRKQMLRNFAEAIFIFLAICLLQINPSRAASSSDTALVGSTPANDFMRSVFTISPNAKIDCMQWNLLIGANEEYTLNITFGELIPNSLRFQNGGEARSFKGKYTIHSHPVKDVPNKIYRLDIGKGTTLDLLRLDENLFHLLTPASRLIAGDAGWSYTLNRKEPVETAAVLPVLVTTAHETKLQMVFEGRTPCAQIAAETALPVKPGCQKVKWQFTLNRDLRTRMPTTFSLKWVDPPAQGANAPIKGTWTVLRGAASNPRAIVYRLEPENTKPIFLLTGSDEVLFFMRQNGQLYTGNGDFSYTLNRKDAK